MYSMQGMSVGYAWNRMRSVNLTLTRRANGYEGVRRVAPASFISWS